MKKGIFVLVLILCTIGFFQAQAMQNYTSGHYSFSYPATLSDIESVSLSFNAYWNSFNEVFHFNPDTATHINRVVICQDKKTFDDYINERIGEKRNEFLFLKYSKPELSELVIYISSTSDEPIFSGPALNRQLFLQFLYSFMSDPPIWIRDGFQAYFEKYSYDTKTKKINPNGFSVWLETAKKLRTDTDKKIATKDLLSAVTGSYESARLYPQAWAFVAFLLNTEKSEYQRFLNESCILLEGSGIYNTESQQENTEQLKTRFARFISAEKCETDFSFWLSGQFTFTELMQTGVSLYNSGNYSASRTTLIEAYDIRNEDPMLLYYLGLVAYAEKDFKTAEKWYKKSLEYGAEISTVNWALSLNAYTEKRWAEARTFLEVAKSANPARYGEKADNLIKSMPK